MRSEYDVIIVGGGLAGFTTSIAMRRLGHRVKVQTSPSA